MPASPSLRGSDCPAVRQCGARRPAVSNTLVRQSWPLLPSVLTLPAISGLLSAQTLLAATDSQGVRGYDLTSASPSLEVRTGRVSGMASEGGRLVVSGEDEVKVYDPRTETARPALTLRDGRARHYNCVAARADLVVAGTEQIKDESFLLFWDLRQAGKLQGGYWETFNDDITSLTFKPGGGGTLLATGCTDGIVNILDLSESDESEALVTSHNTQDSVARLAWYNSSKTADNLAIQTHTEAVQLWRTEEVTARSVLSREAVCHGIRRSCSDYTYIVGLHPHQSEGLTLVAASRCEVRPCLRLARIRNKKVKPLSVLEGAASSSTLVTASLAVTDSCFVTGDEAGTLSVWREEEREEAQDSHQTKIQTKISKFRDKPY